MAHLQKGQLVASGKWADHLRPFHKQKFSGRERSASRAEIEARLAEHLQETRKPKGKSRATAKMRPEIR